MKYTKYTKYKAQSIERAIWTDARKRKK